jgi:hypothetical protein
MKSHDIENPPSNDIENQYKKLKNTGSYKIIRRSKTKKNSHKKTSSYNSYVTAKSSSGTGYGQYIDIEKISKGGKRKNKTKRRLTKF